MENRATRKDNVLVLDDQERTFIEAGPFLIHQGFRGKQHAFGATVACGSSIGHYRNKTSAKKAAKILAGIPGINLTAAEPDEVFPSPDVKRAAFDAVRHLIVA